MTAEEFETNVQSVITRIGKPSLSLYEDFSRFKSEIEIGAYLFNRRDLLIDGLKQVTL